MGVLKALSLLKEAARLEGAPTREQRASFLRAYADAHRELERVRPELKTPLKRSGRGGRQKKSIDAATEAGIDRYLAVGILRGKSGVSPASEGCLVAAWTRAFDIGLLPGPPCSCEECAKA